MSAKPLARHIEETGISLEKLVEASGLEAKLVKAIAAGNYTPSPSERQRLAAALGSPLKTLPGGTRFLSITSGVTVPSSAAHPDQFFQWQKEGQRRLQTLPADRRTFKK